MKIYDLSGASLSDRHGLYGGQAGDKDGIIINGEYWIVKYPKTTRSMTGNDLPSYTTAPLSEYLGSHIYQILGYKTHETVLGWRNNQIVVACKDFCETRGALSEMRTIKNAAYKELSEITESERPFSLTGDRVNIDELILHFQLNPLLQNIQGLQDHFWDCVVIDIFINNNDRNNGNWGLIWDEKNKYYQIAPIYDNGNAFNNKWSEKKISQLLNDPGRERQEAIGGRTVYEHDGHVLSAKKMLELDNSHLKDAVLRVVPKIENMFPEIKLFILEMEETYKGKEVCSKDRKTLYIQGLQDRINYLLLPRYNVILGALKTNTNKERFAAFLTENEANIELKTNKMI